MEKRRFFWVVGGGLVMLLLSIGCNLAGQVGGVGEPVLQVTQTAMAMQEMMIAQQATSLAQQATQAVMNAMATQTMLQTPVPTPTSVPPQPTAAPPTVPPPTAQPPTAPPPTAPPPTAPPTQAATQPMGTPWPTFEEWVQTSRILLYEDMAGDFSITRYVQEALRSLGYPYIDVQDALGRFKAELLSGRSWDLIISAKELRSALSGEFYVYLNDALTSGSSVIIEEWQLDSIWRGKISTILNRCGVEFQSDWFDRPINEQVLWPVGGASPVLSTPFEGVRLSNPTGYWTGDLGDLMRLAPGSDAVPLWSSGTNTPNSYLVAVSCLDNRLIIQTYSTHDYGKDRVVRMWENYIYNALQARYRWLQNH